MGNCSSLLTKQCLGVTDPRYDTSVSNNIVDQDELWKHFAGVWGPTSERRNDLSADNAPRAPSFYDPVRKTGWPYKSDEFTSFRVTTIQGTRLKSQKIYIYGPAPLEFCSQIPPEGLLNTLDANNECGEHGTVQVTEEFGTSNFEKDRNVNLIWVNIGPDSDESSGPPSEEARMSPVEDNAIFSYVNRPGVFTYALTETFYGEGHDYIMAVGSGAAYEPDSPNFKQNSGSLSAPRLDKEAFIAAVKKAYEDNKVPEIPAWLNNGNALDALPDCLAEPWGSCPTSDDWCSLGDPSCSQSPYQEPPASLNAVGIALVAILVAGSVVGFVLFFQRRVAAKQRNRYRSQFAKLMAEHLQHVGHLSQLGPEELEEEFNRIDNGLKSKDGMIQKEELWEWVASGKGGQMERQDFEALFRAMDLDGDGEVSFIEFAGFMATCSTEYDGEVEALLETKNKDEKVKGIVRMVSTKKIQ